LETKLLQKTFGGHKRALNKELYCTRVCSNRYLHWIWASFQEHTLRSEKSTTSCEAIWSFCSHLL